LKPRRVSVLLNDSSGKSTGGEGDRTEAALKAAFDNHGLSADLKSLKGEDLRTAAERALQKVRARESDGIVVGGGDGTISSVAGVLAGSDVPLGIIPLGTLNHFAKDLKIPLAIEDAVALIAAGNTHAVDVGEANGHVFINNSSIGLYPHLVLERERQRSRAGLPKGLALTLAGFRILRYFPLRRLTIRAEGVSEAYRSP
jgi:diacylglycerol kinase family enzyme